MGYYLGHLKNLIWSYYDYLYFRLSAILYRKMIVFPYEPMILFGKVKTHVQRIIILYNELDIILPVSYIQGSNSK